MSKRIGPVQVLLKEGDPRAAGVSGGMLNTLAEEVRTLVQKCHARAVSFLKENRWHLDSLAQRVHLPCQPIPDQPPQSSQAFENGRA